MEKLVPPVFTEKSPELVEAQKIKKLNELILKKLSYYMSPCVAGRFGDNHFSFDAASYYTLLDLSDKKQKLIKLGWGEMSEQTFLAPKDKLIYPETNAVIREINLPIYCLTQQDSYLANKENLKMLESDPVACLKERAVFVYDKMGLGFVGSESASDPNNHFKRRLPVDNLPSVDIDEAITRLELFNNDK